jgi:hypothetical protein
VAGTSEVGNTNQHLGQPASGRMTADKAVLTDEKVHVPDEKEDTPV